MNRFWFRWWLTLTLLVSGALPAPFLNPGRSGCRAPEAPALSSSRPGARPAAFRLSELVEFLRASNQAKDSDSHGPVFKKGTKRDGDGAPPKDREVWLASGLAGLDLRGETDGAGFRLHGRGRVFAFQGMRPEQGGQTGPPGGIASLS